MNHPVYFRVCHICCGMNEKELEVIRRCQHCGHSLAQFYYFDDRLTPVLSDTGIKTPERPGAYEPIRGLTVYWEKQ